MNAMGHNEAAVRLAALAGDALIALDRVTRGAEEAIEGWIAYGAALNEGRALFPGDKEFGQWVEANALSQLATGGVGRDERIAAMWAAANRDDFEAARADCDARTVRGVYSHHKKIEAEREKAAREAERKAKADAERAEREAKAEEAKQRAAEAKANEKKAKAEAKAASDEPARKEAEAKAQKAADEAARAEAEAKQASAAAAAESEPEPAPDPYGYARLTEEALLDLANGLRASLDEEKAKRKKAEADAKALRERLADFTDSESHEVIRRLQAKVKHMESERFRADEKFAAEKRRTYALKKEIKSITGQEIEL